MVSSVLISEASAVSLCVIILVWYSYRIVYNIYFHPLSKFPGPKLAGASRWYEGYYDLIVGGGGQYVYKTERMHEEYGPIVRLGPNEVHINEPKFRNILYAGEGKRHKVNYIADIFGVPYSAFGTLDHDLHRQRRAVLNPFFSKKSVMSLDSVIQDKAQKMCDNVESHYQNSTNIKVRHAIMATTIDIITEYSFARCANALDGDNFSPHWNEMNEGISELVPVARSYPGIVQIAQKLPLSLMKVLNPIAAEYNVFARLIRKQVEDVFAEHKLSSKVSEKKAKTRAIPTIFTEILESDIPEHEKTVDRLTEEALAIVGAASETSATTMTTAIYYAVSNPEYAKRLGHELRTVMPTPTSKVKWTQLEQLPFLTAIIKESMRVSCPIYGRMPIEAEKPLQFNEWTIPAGTYIGMSLRDSMEHPDIYPNPKQFIPERWLTASPSQLKEMDAYFVPFNRGPRICVGMHLAYANMYHILAALFRRFELEIVDTVYERDLKTVRDYWVPKPSRESKGVTMKVVRVKNE